MEVIKNVNPLVSTSLDQGEFILYEICIKERHCWLSLTLFYISIVKDIILTRVGSIVNL